MYDVCGGASRTHEFQRRSCVIIDMFTSYRFGVVYLKKRVYVFRWFTVSPLGKNREKGKKKTSSQLIHIHRGKAINNFQWLFLVPLKGGR